MLMSSTHTTTSEHTETHRRYRQIPVGNVELASTKWVDVPNFDIRKHIYEHTLAAPGGKKEQENLVSEIFTGILDRSKPRMLCESVTPARRQL